MGYKKLSLEGFINEMHTATQSAHPRRFCFVLGAGASRTSGIKSGQEMVREWNRDLQLRDPEGYERWRAEHRITDENMEENYSRYYEKLFDPRSRDGYAYMERCMASATPSAGYAMLAYLLSRTPNKVVVTTNFDRLIEDSVNYYAHCMPMVIGHEALSHYVESHPDRVTVIKIHHDLLFDPKSKRTELETLSERWQTALSVIFRDAHPVFLGYAGNDQNVMDFLMQNSGKFASGEWRYPYWLLYHEDALEGKVRAFLDASGGYCIRHYGFDSVMIGIGNKFRFMIPTEEEFLKEPKARLKKLQDSFDEAMKPEPVKPDGKQKKDEKAAAARRDMERNVSEMAEKSQLQKKYAEATTLYGQRNYKQALPLLEELVKQAPGKALYQLTYGHTYFCLKQFDKAAERYRVACALKPENAEYQYWLGRALAEENKTEEAAEKLRLACDLAPNEIRYVYSLARALNFLGDHEEALELIDRYIAADPDRDGAYTLRQLALEGLGRTAEAEEAAKKAKELKEKKA